ncbi:hypothetical protein [Streptomyces sp. NBRC 110611]|uniref:hypothetical protein n=1 Tax=Streptomyces sp. NBRC 110611 TaxID=1621259 RepID=UPI000A4D99EE
MLDTRKSGDADRARGNPVRPVRSPDGPGNTESTKLLAKVVGVADAATGTVRLATGDTGRRGRRDDS